MYYKRNFVLCTLLLLFSGKSFAKINPLIQCLAKEEEQIFKKKNAGPLYKLNQAIFNEIVSLYHLEVKEAYLKKICHSKTHTPSISFLKEYLINEEALFDKRVDQEAEATKAALIHSSLLSLNKRIPEVLFQYLSSLQALAKIPRCLESQIPALRNFMEQYKYLESERPQTILKEQKQNLLKIFNYIPKIDKLLSSCNSKKA